MNSSSISELMIRKGLALSLSLCLSVSLCLAVWLSLSLYLSLSLLLEPAHAAASWGLGFGGWALGALAAPYAFDIPKQR